MRTVEEPARSPYVADISYSMPTNSLQHELETNVSARSIDFGNISQFPYHFDNCAFYHAPNSTTHPTATKDNPRKEDVYRDIFDYLENFCCNSPSTGTDRDNTVPDSDRSYSVNDTISTSDSYCSGQQEDGLHTSPDHMSCRVFEENEGPMTLFQTLECLDFPEAQPLPLQAQSNIWCSKYSSVAKNSSQQIEVSGQLASISKMQSESDSRQQNWISCTQPQRLCDNYAEFRTPCHLDFSEDFAPTFSLMTTDTLSQHHLVVTADLRELTDRADSESPITSSAVSGSSTFPSSESAAGFQTSCRRRLFGDTIRYPNEFAYTVSQTLQLGHRRFQESEKKTSCAVSENERHSDNPLPAPSHSEHMLPESSRCCERHSCVVQKTLSNHGMCYPLANSGDHLPVSSPGKDGKTKPWRCHRLFDDAHCNKTDQRYRVRENWQQHHHDSFHTTSVVAYNEVKATTPPPMFKCFDSLGSFSPREAVEKASQISCRRQLFDDTRLRKSSATVHRCYVCDRSYTRPSSLRDHVRTHHSTTPKPHLCSVCGRRFSQLSNLGAHQRVHTGERPFQCPVNTCGRRFSQSSSLSTHLRTHSGVRPYVCGECGRAFTDSSTRTKHVRVHTGARPYRCDLCMAAFSQSGNLRRHRRIHLPLNVSLP